MKVAIIGTGTVGGNLGRGLAAAGHAVRFGSRDPGSPDVVELLDELDGARAGTHAEVAAWAEAVVLAVPASAAVEVAREVRDELDGAVVLDPTNRVPAPEDRRSVAEDVAAALPGAAVAKAFNTVGAEWFLDPTRDGEAASMPVCGDEAAVAVATDLAADLGFDPVDAGDLAAAGMLEDLARLWIHLAGTHGRGIAFRLLR